MTKKSKKAVTPIPDSHLETGVIYPDAEYNAYVGVASDKVHVHIGSLCDKEGAEAYLRANPTPDMW